MSAESPLQRWLQEASNSGQFDSEGRFTVDQKKAWEKLAAYQLTFAEAWVLKVVQAAVSHPQATLQIRPSRGEVEFVFCAVRDWTEPTLQKALLEPNSETPQPLKHLTVAIRVLVGQKSRPFSVHYPDGLLHAWTGSGFRELSRSTAPTETFILSVGNFEFGQSQSYFAGTGKEAAAYREKEMRAFREHCHLAPARVKLGRSTAGGLISDPYLGEGETTRPFAVFKDVKSEQSPSFHLPAPRFKSPLLGQFVVPLQQVSPHQQEGSVTSFLTIFFSKNVVRKDLQMDRYRFYPSVGRSQVIWIRDGVVVLRESLKMRQTVGLGVVLSADGLETDISGLRPRESEEKHNRLEYGLSRALKQLKEYRESPKARKRLSIFKGLRVGSAISSLAGGALLTTTPGFAVLGLLILGKSTPELVAYERERRRLNLVYTQGFDELIRELEDRVDKV